MIDSLQFTDPDIVLAATTKKDIIDSLTIEDIETFLKKLGVEQIASYPEKGYLICPTICHNPLTEEASMKLYWYQNNKIFRCYTECNEAMSIFTLYKKFILINENREVSDEEAEEYVKQSVKNLHHNAQSYSIKRLDLNKYKFSKSIPQLKEYPIETLDRFVNYYHPAWLKDGITVEAMKKFHIGFALGQNKITIPHFDINGRLIGIRARTIDEQEAELYGKYRPIQIGDIMYNHQLEFNLYGIYEHQNAIRKRRSAIIAEGEKSVLLDEGYYGDLSNTVACCGSSINKYHISLLTNVLGVNEITIAFDKEYETCYTTKAKEYRKKLEDIGKKYSSQATFYYIWDYDNVLKEKDSPFDRGKDIFEHLYKTKVKVRG